MCEMEFDQYTMHIISAMYLEKKRFSVHKGHERNVYRRGLVWDLR